MRTRLAKTTTVIACLVGLGLGGCGSGDDEGAKIPATTRQELEKQLKSVGNRFDAGGGACSDIAENQQSIERTLDSLPPEVEKDLRDALRDGFDRLFELAAEQCDGQKDQQTETETTPTVPPPAPETDIPTTPTETETEPEEKQEKPDKGKDKDSGKGNGKAKGGGGSLPQAGGGGGALAPGELP